LEWLAVADKHGHETASRYQEEDELSGIVASSTKKKRLQVAIEASKAAAAPKVRKAQTPTMPPPVRVQPFQQSTPASAGSSWSASSNIPVTPSFVLSVIRHGYILPFTSLPTPKIYRNHKSAFQHLEFVQESVLSLVERGCARESIDPVVCSPLGVVDNGKKLRLILDLRYVNKHLASFKFKLEDLKTVLEVYKQGDFVVTFDLKSGYHHITIAENHRKYLGFSCLVNGQAKTYEFCVLPFGLSTAPYIFTKITRPILSLWRRQGIRCQLYMDDGSGGHATFNGAVEVAKVIRNKLSCLGCA